MPRYVVLHHELPPASERPSHWDLMLERDGALRTWALSQLPAMTDRVPATLDAGIQAAALPDHRLAYLDYEGPVSGGRGQVTRVDAGTYDVLEESPERLRIRFQGGRLAGDAELVRFPPANPALEQADQRWAFRCPGPSA